MTEAAFSECIESELILIIWVAVDSLSLEFPQDSAACRTIAALEPFLTAETSITDLASVDQVSE
jgi:hypothetical protein